MNCPACAHENRPGAKFCEECAAPLPRACAGCGAELRPTAKFCDECGAPTAAAPRPTAPPRATAAEPADTRKVVTIVFGDLVGSTALHERVDAESVRLFMESYYAAMRGAVEAHGGRVTQVMGDGVKAVFGAPRVSEDDALRAVRAGVAMQDAFRTLAEQQRGRVGKTGLRVAVNTGEVVANEATEIIGDPVNVAARLQEQGRDGDVVIGESTHRLVSSLVTLELLGSFALKGRSEAVKAYRVVSLERPAGAATAPFVGRDEELARLTAVYTTAVETPAARLAVLVGSPGLGKSRLIDEFARRHAGGATVVLAHCDAAGGATFAPLGDALRALLGIDSGASAETLRATIESALPAEDADRTRIASGIAALLAGAPPSPEETFFVVRRMLGALARSRPVVLAIDDLHWAEPLLLDLVEHLIQWGGGVPLLVLIGARPELRDLRSSLVTPGGFVADVVTLSGLDAGAAMRLAANVIGAADLPAAIAAKVLATSEGNPLFVGELVRMLVQEGAITRAGDRWIAGDDLAALAMPPTIHALLAARIERLRPEERTVLERAAVVGRHFSRSAVAALSPQTVDLDARLEALRRSELIERDTGWLLGEPVLRFHHVLIRDAAYRRLLKGTRAELHTKLADWIEAQAGPAPEHDETIGWHLEQAHQFLRELGPLDANGERLGARAATHLAAAGRRALARDDLAVAADLLGRAIARLDADDPARAELALDWCEALLAAGDVGRAAKAIEELGRFVQDEGLGGYGVTGLGQQDSHSPSPNPLTPNPLRLRAWHTCFVGQHTVLTAPSALHETTGAVAAAAEALTALGDGAGEAKAHYVHALALARLGKVGACEAALDRALAAARRAHDRRRANTVLALAPLAALWGPSPVTRASGRCLDVVRVLRITQGAPAVEAVALSCQGVLEALRGRTKAARRMIAAARKLVEELGITQRLLEADASGGFVALLEGDASGAERCLRGAYHGLRDLGLGTDAARAAALLARALLAQGRVDEAEALSHESEALAGDDLKAAIAWRGVRAEALARRGEHGDAIALATRAVELAAATDALLDHADARIALAAALRAAGRAADARAEEGRARELWQAKGATLLADRAANAEAPVARPFLSLMVADADGNLARAEWSDDDREAQALARFEALAPHDPEAPAELFANAASRLLDRAAHQLWAARDWDGILAMISPAIRMDDRRRIARLEIGYEEFLAQFRMVFDQPRSRWRARLCATRGERLALIRTCFEADVADGGGPLAVDEHLSLAELDAEGRIVALVVFDLEDADAACAELDARHDALEAELTAPEAAGLGPFENAASSAWRAVNEAWSARDLDRFEALHAAVQRYRDHRRLFQLDLDRAGFLDFTRPLLAMRAGDASLDLVATRGERLALMHSVMRMEDDAVGPSTIESLMMIETDEDGAITAYDRWDLEDREAAVAELEARWLTGEGAQPTRPQAAVGFDAALARRDWDAVAACFTPEFVGHDQRLVGWETVHGPAELVRTLQEMVALAPDARMRLNHLRVCARGSIGDVTWVGTRDGGAFEIPFLNVSEFDVTGRFVRVDFYDAQHADRAFARFEALRPDPLRIPPNAAAHAQVRLDALTEAADWDGMRALCAPVAFDDRRRGLRTTGDCDTIVESARFLRDAGQRPAHTLLATAGDRLALHRGLWRDEPERPTSEAEMLELIEVNERGEIVALVLFDAEQHATALDELFERYVALGGEGMPACLVEFKRALDARDLARARAVLADDFIYHDRRRTGAGRLVGPDAYLASPRAWWDLSDDARIDMLYSVAVAPHGRVAVNRMAGRNLEGGAFESFMVTLLWTRGERVAGAELFEVDQMDAALARLEELRPDPPASSPTPATRMRD